MSLAVLLAHGSPDPRSGAAVRTAAAEVGRLSGYDVAVAFLDHDQPRLDAVVAEVDVTTDVVVLPLLLSSAYHARVDVPAEVRGLARPVTLLDPVGHPQPVLRELLARGASPVVVAAAGTSAEDERDAFAAAVAGAAAATAVRAVPAYATGPGPSVAEALAALHTDAVVVPWLLGPGRLLDSVRAAAGAHRVRGGGLLAEPALLRELAGRLVAPAG